MILAKFKHGDEWEVIGWLKPEEATIVKAAEEFVKWKLGEWELALQVDEVVCYEVQTKYEHGSTIYNQKVVVNCCVDVTAMRGEPAGS
jgi:hypothetical protein